LFTLGAVRDVVADAYGLDVTGCTLLPSFVNDVYAITTPGRRYLLKVYRHGYWSPDEVAWELDLTRHLLCSGVPVPNVVPLADGRLAGVIAAPEGKRPYALTAFVESGAKARKPFRQTEHWDAFADGYQRVRPLRDNDLAALPWFTIAGNISNLTGLRAAAKDLLG
jgi:Ser/Thr protein kinase RdoA (MazF antagonist)